MAKVLAAMSGGVDSSVAALELIKAGHEVHGIYMKNWINEENVFGECPWQEDIEDAQAVCKCLDIPFTVVNFIKEYRENVVSYLVDGYKKGITPNPDVMCNREMKFGVLLDYAVENGFEYVATGHYCRKLAVTLPDGSKDYGLFEGVDKNKDQSYFLSLITHKQLQHALFPIGHIEKPKLREIALEAGLPNARKKDSQGICFIGNVKMSDFLEKFIPDSPGNIVNVKGQKLGTHKGLHRYTLGQRRGIGVPSNSDGNFFVVVGKNLEANELIVAFEAPETPGLYQTEMRLHNISWIHSPILEKTDILTKPRYRDPSVRTYFKPESESAADIQFEEPQRAIAKGQICALYQGEWLLGGAVYF